MKKRLTILFALTLFVVLLCAFSIGASAETVDGECGAQGDNVTWRFDEGTGVLTISGTGAMDDFEFDATPWRLYNLDIEAVRIEDGVTSIGSKAFSFCNMTSITIPSSVTSIGLRAFTFCEKLTSVTIPEGVTSVSEYLFEQCASLTTVTLPNNLTSIGDWAFVACSSLADVTIPKNVTSIGFGAFSGCESLTSIKIPAGVTAINPMSFYICTGLKKVTLPKGLVSIGDSAFVRCTDLETMIYCGTEEEWAGITKGNYWNYNVPTSVQFHDFENGACVECLAEAPHSHVWDDGVITTEPSENAEGVKTFTCACGESKTETIAKLPATGSVTIPESTDSDTDSDADANWNSKGENHSGAASAKSGCGASVGAPILLLTLIALPFVTKKKED